MYKEMFLNFFKLLKGILLNSFYFIMIFVCDFHRSYNSSDCAYFFITVLVLLAINQAALYVQVCQNP